MKTKKEMSQAYKDRRKPAGIFHIKNMVTGRVFLGSSLDLDGVLNSHRFRLQSGLHPNEAMQKDWRERGEGDFRFEILETVPAAAYENDTIEDELKLLEEIWLERFPIPGELLYNTDTNLRRV